MAKLGREAKLREKRVEKQARKAARKLSAADPAGPAAPGAEEHGHSSNGLDDGAEAQAVAAGLEIDRSGAS